MKYCFKGISKQLPLIFSLRNNAALLPGGAVYLRCPQLGRAALTGSHARLFSSNTICQKVGMASVLSLQSKFFLGLLSLPTLLAQSHLCPSSTRNNTQAASRLLGDQTHVRCRSSRLSGLNYLGVALGLHMCSAFVPTQGPQESPSVPVRLSCREE